MIIVTQWNLFCVLFLREWHMYKSRLSSMAFNFVVLGPLIFILTQGYIKPLMFFGAHPGRMGTILFAGSIVLIALNRAFDMGLALFQDMTQHRVLDVQLQAIPLHVVLAARFFFAVISSWVLLLPTYPMAAFVLGDFFYAQQACWSAYAVVLFLTIMVLMAYAFLTHALAHRLQTLTNVRLRYNEFLIWFGGFNAPWFIMQASDPIFGWIALCNPVMYATEALRQTLVPGPEFFSLWVSIPVMVVTVLFCLSLSYGILKRRIESVQLYRPV